MQNLNQEFQILIRIVCEGIEEFKSYDSRRIAVSVNTSRAQGRFGVWAYVVPLRYVGGLAERKGRRWGFSGVYRYEAPQVEERHPEARYIMSFMFPRFFRLTPRERLETIVHELYHLHPSLRGDLRRFPAPHIHHGPTPAAYKRKVKSLTAEALKQFPTLLEHPLIRGDETAYREHGRERLALPRRVWRSSGLGGIFSRGLLLLAMGAAALPAQAADRGVYVRATRMGKLYDQATAKGHVISVYEEGETFQALRQSPRGTWLQVKRQGGETGYVPKKFFVVTQRPSADARALYGRGGFASEEKNVEDDDFEVGDEKPPDLEDADNKLDRYEATRRGRFFEKPNVQAERFGLIEVGDELRYIEDGASGKWVKVRLSLTGEEGWYPKAWMKVNREKRLLRGGPNQIEVRAGYGTTGVNFGFGVGYSRNLTPSGVSDRPRDRIEIGLDADYFLGGGETLGADSYEYKLLNAALFPRYVLSSDTGFFAAAAELGVAYSYAMGSSTVAGFDLQEGWGISFMAGVRAVFSLSERFVINLGARMQMAGTTVAIFSAGLGFRF